MDTRYTKLREREKEIEREIIARNTAVIGTDEFDHVAWLEAEHDAVRDEKARFAEVETMDGVALYE